MEIPDKTWGHIVEFMQVVEEYPRHSTYLNAVEHILNLLRTVIQDTQREVEPCQD
jgi:hypothetical protein